LDLLESGLIVIPSRNFIYKPHLLPALEEKQTLLKISSTIDLQVNQPKTYGLQKPLQSQKRLGQHLNIVKNSIALISEGPH
jgi:hypothetical protein